MALAWTFETAFRQHRDGADARMRVFSQSFQRGFPDIVEKLDLYHGTYHTVEEFIPAMSEETGDGAVDLVVFGTCEYDLPYWHSELLTAWDTRDHEHKFKIVCIVHQGSDRRWQVHIPDWSRRGALHILPISEHVQKTFKLEMDEHAESTDPAVYSAGYEHIPIDTHVPVLDLPDLPDKPLNRTLSKAVIQGSFESLRRNYTGFFTDLIQSLHEDPAAWGYESLDGRESFVPDSELPDPPFRLYLVGSGSIDIPAELLHVITIYRDLNYTEFYAIVADMDIVVPAFSDFSYYMLQATSTVAMAVEVDVPILATRHFRKSYDYANDDRAIITRPAAMREVHALKALRTGDATSFLRSDPAGQGHMIGDITAVREAVEYMLQGGFTRRKEDVRAYKEGVWRKNLEVAGRLLTDA
ncbi:hypothetical protein OBBRIDRAFT_741660 [Obba rivulosa]|uniref:Uncharacterized protein n=1 Tax=Obba rivulosa TaxID=1052685 RepID=A0A8E2DF43_9APHY|nr:hypothetical protein OBBRIDRAFT_741660 [Obba rivulosa]